LPTEPSQGGKSLKKIVVVGIGNLLRQDDGVGVHAIRALEEIGLPEEVELGLELSPQVVVQMPRLLELIRLEVDSLMSN
jgi:Ni,Fe-hydrogenase maturation factor